MRFEIDFLCLRLRRIYPPDILVYSLAGYVQDATHKQTPILIFLLFSITHRVITQPPPTPHSLMRFRIFTVYIYITSHKPMGELTVISSSGRTSISSFVSQYSSVNRGAESRPAVSADQRIGGAPLYNQWGHVSELGCPSGVDWSRNRCYDP